MARFFGMISTAGSLEYTAPALESFFRHSTLTPADTFVLLDNDGSWRAAAATAPGSLELIVNPEPQSFAQNANLLLERADQAAADLYLLNNDIIFTPGWLEAMQLDLPLLVIPCCNQHRSYQTAAWRVEKSLTLSQYRGHEAELLQIVNQHRRNQSGFIPIPSGCFYAVKIPRELYQVVGRFDTAYGIGGAEDNDYCLRTYLAGYGVVLARGAYLLHFQGRSTWLGPETPAETARRDQIYLAAFTNKWGEKLRRWLLQGETTLLEEQPDLVPAAQRHDWQKIISALQTEESRRHFRPWRPRTAAVYCLHYPEAWLPYSVRSIYEQVDQIYFLLNQQAWNGADLGYEATAALLAALPDPAGKMLPINGRWSSETEQRNAALPLLQEAGCDYYLIIDADEIYNPPELAELLGYAARRRYIAVWQVHLFTYWKSCRFRIDPPESFTPPVLLKVGQGEFCEARNVTPQPTQVIPSELVRCHHLSYARTNEEVLRKIRTFSHSHQIVPGWYEQVWLVWDQNPRLRNLHPCWPRSYGCAIEQPRALLPTELQPYYDQGALPQPQ